MRNQVFKKLFSVLLALIMVAGLLPASVLAEGEGNADSTPAPTEAVQPTESAEPTAPTETETPEVTEVPAPTPENPAATVEPTQGEPTAEPTDEGIMPANVMPVQANVELQYRIVHLDCGRKYFSKDWIIALMYEAKAAGYNQVQLAFGNKGLRFLLDDMSVNTYEKQAVTDAIKEGNKAYYNAGEKNELTEAEMNEILAVAKKSALKSFLFSIRLSIWKPLLRQWDSLIFKMHIMATIKLA
jgi:type IV secretory pathway VirB10-like protein